MAGEWTKLGNRFRPLLAITPQRGTVTRLAEVMRGVGPSVEIEWAATAERGFALAEALGPKLLFVDREGPGIDGPEFVRRLRRSAGPARQAPVILVSDQATLGAMREAQNAGAHEFLVRPYSAAQLSKRLDAICAPRDWYETETYVGPDRRRFNSAELPGPDRRAARRA